MPSLIVNPNPPREDNIVYDLYTRNNIDIDTDADVVHVMHPDLIIEGYDVLYNKVGCSGALVDNNGETIIVNSVDEYLEQLKPTVTSIVDQSANPAIQWSCDQLGLHYSSNGIVPQWDPVPLHKGHNRVSSVLKHYIPELWDVVNDDIHAYILISLIIHDDGIWTDGLEHRNLYLLMSPFRTKVNLFIKHLAPQSFMELYKSELSKVTKYIPQDYTFDFNTIINYYIRIAKHEFDTRDEALNINLYDTFKITSKGYCFLDNTFNYVNINIKH